MKCVQFYYQFFINFFIDMDVNNILTVCFALIVSLWSLPIASCRNVPFGLNALSSGGSVTMLPLKGKDLKQDWCVGRSVARKVHHPGCNSTEVKSKLCFGQCMTFFIQTSRSPFLTCSQCSPTEMEAIEVKLKCANGTTKKKKVLVVRRCSCTTCRFAKSYLRKVQKDLYLSQDVRSIAHRW